MHYHHDLKRLLRGINDVYFDGLLDVKVEWFRPTPPRKTSKRVMLYGYYDVWANTIKLNPSLNSPKVPQFFINYILMHEALHSVIPPAFKPGHPHDITDASNVEDWHPPAFYEAEARFAHIKRAELWEEKNRAWLMAADCKNHPRKSRKQAVEDDHDDD